MNQVQSEHVTLPEQIQIPESPDLMKSSRNKFVAKVYSILAMQLLITTAFVSLAMSSPSFTQFVSENFALQILGLVVAIGIIIAFAVKKWLGQTYPINMLLLLVFTLAESFLVASTCSLYDADHVLLAAGITASATVGLTIYTLFSKADFTTYLQGLTAIGWSFFMSITFLTLINFWIVNIPMTSNLIALGFAILYSAYLVIDTQLIMGKGKHNLSLDDYILGSIMLYLDILGLFLELLRILGKRNR